MPASVTKGEFDCSDRPCIKIRFRLSAEGQKRALNEGTNASRDHVWYLYREAPEWDRALRLASLDADGCAKIDMRPCGGTGIDHVGRAWRPAYDAWEYVPSPLRGTMWSGEPTVAELLETEEKRRIGFAAWKNETPHYQSLFSRLWQAISPRGKKKRG